MRARRSSSEWSRLIFIHLIMGIGGAFVVWTFFGRVLGCLPMPPPREKWELVHACSRPLRALYECGWVALEAFNP